MCSNFAPRRPEGGRRRRRSPRRLLPHRQPRPILQQPPPARLPNPPEMPVDDNFDILVIDDEESIRHMLSLLLGAEGWQVDTAGDGQEGLKRVLAQDYDLALCDVRMPELDGLEFLAELDDRDIDTTVIVMSAFGSRELAVKALKAGAYDYIDKPFEKDEILLTVVKAIERLRLQRENEALRRQVGDHRGLGRLVGQSEPMQEVFALIEKVSQFKSTVLVSGESGTGKELVAKAIHELSDRADESFVAVNCGAIPAALLESELFGHVEGAFTDASADKEGLFMAADGGTLFLDEIAELPAELQVKLLRVLQEGEVRRVGESTPQPVDARIIAATLYDLEKRVEDGDFREDLYYRLHVIGIDLPPLRERPADIPLLVDHFIAEQNQRLDTDVEGLTSDAMDTLLNYNWPGNVRELQNCIERGVVLSPGSHIGVDDLPMSIREGDTPLQQLLAGDDLSIKKLTARLEKMLITRALTKTDGNRTHAADLLDISHRTLLYKIKDYDIDL